MSADLFAAFRDDGVGHQPPKSAQNIDTGLEGLSLQATSHGTLQTSKQQELNDDDFDDFGEFETARQDHDDPPTSTAVPERNIAADTDWAAWTEEQNPTSWPNPSRSDKTHTARPRPRDENIMFDAEDSDEALWDQAGDLEDDNDDFGDFEGTAANLSHTSLPPSSIPATSKTPSTSRAPPNPSSPMVDLLGLDTETDSHSSSGPLQQFKSEPKPTTARAKPARHKAQSPKKPVKAVAERPSKQTEETWDDFETTTPANTTTTTDTLPQDPQIAVPSALLHRLAQLHAEPTQRTQRPTTIPPPSVLLPLFSSTINTLTHTFLTPLSTLPPPTKSTLLTNPNTASLLRAYALFTTILARILAGRKHRWKRDKYLAQSMAIGPSGTRSGMKIAGLDRSEVGREDQVVEDVLATWGKQVGRLRNVVGAFNAAVGERGRVGAVPELAVTMPIRVAKGAEGAVVGLQPCALCGLKREERVAKVDSEVEDSFGEWWVEGVNMHTSCAVFWEGWQDELRGR